LANEIWRTNILIYFIKILSNLNFCSV
jgi:hypothetical protein